MIGATPRILRVTTDADGPLVVLMHGFAGAPEDLEPFAHSLGVPGRFVFPEGFEQLEAFGLPGRAWWPSDGAARDAAMRSGEGRDLSDFEPPGLREARQRLSELLKELMGELPARKLILGGFSQGAMLAFDVALQTELPITALVQLSGARIARRQWDQRLPTRTGMRTFISHGRQDTDLAFSACQSFECDLRAAGWEVSFCPFDGGHEVPLVALRALKRFLLAASRPD